ncbi:TonB-dependent receptor [Sphingobium cloacae]|uniref:Uncharacterized protein n=1 Tax=Sphingobium cloacae TaxID=120107 RepID=A0A1E1F909_9SPHN|nr:TonB-dependent receptor [Sphingobium cloacae]BAV67006.1 hypothetical protein SCLO_7000060 [Sphingobium cloacae]
MIGEQVVGGLRQPVLASFEGVALPFSAKWQYSVRAELTQPLSGELEGFVNASVHGQSKSYSTLALTAQSRADYLIDGYALVDGAIGVKTTDERWRLTLWGKNIFNKYYVTNRYLPYDSYVRYAGRPAEYGVTAASATEPARPAALAQAPAPPAEPPSRLPRSATERRDAHMREDVEERPVVIGSGPSPTGSPSGAQRQAGRWSVLTSIVLTARPASLRLEAASKWLCNEEGDQGDML